ncbi:unnamed protein product [Ectocarpus fasciculatus]
MDDEETQFLLDDEDEKPRKVGLLACPFYLILFWRKGGGGVLVGGVLVGAETAGVPLPCDLVHATGDREMHSLDSYADRLASSGNGAACERSRACWRGCWRPIVACCLHRSGARGDEERNQAQSLC